MVDWNIITGIASAVTALATFIIVIVYARIARIMWQDLVMRQRPYVFVESLNAKVSGTGIPKDAKERIRPSEVGKIFDTIMENWIYIKNAGPVPAKLKPIEVTYMLDGIPIDTGETTTKVAAIFPGQQAHNIATLSSGLGQVFSKQKVLTLRIRIDYDHIGTKDIKQFFSEITLRYVVHEENLWACSWDYDHASGN